MARHALPAVLTAFLFSACTGDAYVQTAPGAGGAEEEQFTEFDGASLVVHSPASGTIHFLDEGLELNAEVLDAEGDPMDFEEISWSLDGDEDPLFVGTEDVVDVDWGIHDLTVTAELPNGDRLVHTLGGLRVQGRRTGIYAGNLTMNADLEFNGQAFTASCVGGLDFVVAMDGETLVGDGACSLVLVILDPIDVSYALDGLVDNGGAEGDLGLDLGFFDVPVGWEGAFDDDRLVADFAGSAILFDFDGTIEADRISLYVDPDAAP